MAISRKSVQKSDLLLITLLLVLALGLFLWFTASPGQTSAVAIVEVDGEEVARYELAHQKQEQVIDLGGDYQIQLKLAPGAIAFYHSDCPDQTCIRTGTLRAPGQVAVCLPARVSIRIIGETAYDGMTG